MTQRSNSRLVAVAAASIVIAMMKWAAVVVVPFLLAVLLATIIAPTAHDTRIPRALRLPVAFAIPFLVLGAVGWLVVHGLGDVMGAAPDYLAALERRRAEMVVWLVQLHLRSAALWVNSIDATDIAASLAKGTADAVMDTLLATLAATGLAVFMVAESVVLPRKLDMMGRTAQRTLGRLQQRMLLTHKYLLVKTGVSVATGLAAALLTHYAKVPHPALWGLTAFLLNFIPAIGSLIAAVPAIAIAWLTQGAPTAALVAAGYLAINTVLGNIIEPRLAGDAVGLSPLVVMCSMMFWGWVLGPFGAVVSVPLTLVARMALAYDDDWRWLAVLLGSLKLAQREVQRPSVLPDRVSAGNATREASREPTSRDSVPRDTLPRDCAPRDRMPRKTMPVDA